MGLKKLLFFVSSILVFSSVVLFVHPPLSWQEANLFQIMIFFLPLIVITTILIDIIIKYLPHSFIISLGLLLCLALYAVNKFSILSGSLVILTTLFLYRIFPKMKFPKFRLTYAQKIPKLQMSNAEPRRLRRLRRLR